MKPPEFPLEVKKDSSTVTIYEREFTKPDKEGKTRHYVEYRLAWYEDRQRKLETSADFLAIRTRADEVLEDLNEGRRTDQGAIKASERNDYQNAVKLLAPTRQPLHVAVSHFVKAVEILGSDMVIAAAQEYVKRHLNKLQHRTVSQAVQEFTQDKERQQRSAVHVNRLKIHLGRFAESMKQSIASVTALEINRFLDSLTDDDNKPVGPRTRDNYADSIVALFRWAKKKRYVASDFDEMERITRLAKDEDSQIEIYSPAELKPLLSKADASLIPFLAIGAFAGLRSSEILRLDWADVRMENGDPHIVVQKGKVKMRGKSRRIVPMTDNLKAWLKPHIQPSGPVWPQSEPLLYRRLQELAPEAEALLQKADPKASLTWKSNALRHSFISYRVADVKNVAQVALEAGNSPQMIFSNYRELVTEQDAQNWFAILPSKKGKAKK